MLPPKRKAQVMTFGADEEMKDDSVLAEDVPAKPRGPPKRLAAKKGAKPDGDGEGLANDSAPPKKGPPARLAARAAAAAPSGPAKTVKADDIQEEDIGAGMSKEQAIE